jgi:uncharacterized protein (TIRG00374 family)
MLSKLPSKLLSSIKSNRNSIFQFFAFFIVIVISLGYFKANYEEIRDYFKLIEPIWLIASGIVFIITIYANSIVLTILLEIYGIDIKNSFTVTTASAFLNYFLPMRGGAVYRSIYLNKLYNFNYPDFIASFFGTYIIVFLANSIFNLLILLLVWIQYSIFNIFLFGLFIGILFGTLLLLLYKKEIHLESKRFNFITSKANKIIKGWQVLNRNPRAIGKLAFVIIVINILTALQLSIIFKGFGQEVDLLKTALLSSTSFISIFVNITPGSIGITEGIMAFVASITDIDVNLIVSAQVIRRLTEALILFILGGSAYYKLNKELFNLAKKDEIKN